MSLPLQKRAKITPTSDTDTTRYRCICIFMCFFPWSFLLHLDISSMWRLCDNLIIKATYDLSFITLTLQRCFKLVSTQFINSILSRITPHHYRSGYSRTVQSVLGTLCQQLSFLHRRFRTPLLMQLSTVHYVPSVVTRISHTSNSSYQNFSERTSSNLS